MGCGASRKCTQAEIHYADFTPHEDVDDLTYNTPFENEDTSFFVRFKVSFFDGESDVDKFYAIAPQHTDTIKEIPWKTRNVIGTAMKECVECFPDKEKTEMEIFLAEKKEPPPKIFTAIPRPNGVQFNPDKPIHIVTCRITRPIKPRRRTNPTKSPTDDTTHTSEDVAKFDEDQMAQEHAEPEEIIRKMWFSASFLHSARTRVNLKYKNSHANNEIGNDTDHKKTKFFLVTMKDANVCMIISKGSNNCTIHEMFFNPDVCSSNSKTNKHPK